MKILVGGGALIFPTEVVKLRGNYCSHKNPFMSSKSFLSSVPKRGIRSLNRSMIRRLRLEISDSANKFCCGILLTRNEGSTKSLRTYDWDPLPSCNI